MELLWNETPRRRWQEMTDAAAAPFQQTWAYGEAARPLGSDILRLELRRKGRTFALAQGLARRFLFPTVLFSMGPVWIGEVDQGARVDALKFLRRNLKGIKVSTPPDRGCRAALRASGFKDVMTPGTFAEMPLDANVRQRMSVKWRNRLVAAEKHGLTLRATRDAAAFQWLLDADARQQKIRHYRALPRAFTTAWRNAQPNSTLLLIAGKLPTPTAAMLFLHHGTTATYHIGWTGDEGRAQNAHNLLLYEAAMRLAAMGVKRLNLGPIDTENAPGLARFKLGAGARPVETGGTWLGW